MGGRGQTSRSSGISRGGQTLSYRNAVMPKRNVVTAGYRIRSNRDLFSDRMERSLRGGSAETVYSRNSKGRLLINRDAQNRRRESDRAEAREQESQRRRERAERELWNTAFTNMFRR